jgi:flagellar protein FlgJ
MSPSDINFTSSDNSSWQGQAETSKLLQMQKQFMHPTSTDQKKLKKAAQEFESIFVQQLLEAMDKTVDRENSLTGGGSAEDYWRSMMNEEVAKSITTRPGGSGFGLAETVYRQMAANAKMNAGADAANGAPQAGTAGAGTTEVQP